MSLKIFRGKLQHADRHVAIRGMGEIYTKKVAKIL